MFRLVIILCLAISGMAWAQGPATTGDRAEPMEILSMRDRAALEDKILKRRLDHLLPQLMRERGIDMWILIAREYNEDPVVETMLPAKWLSARRRTILVFADDGETVKRFAVARYPVGDLFATRWNPEREPDQWRRLVDIVEEADPETIALNTSEHFGLADGLSYQQHKEFMAVLPRKYRRRVVSGEDLALDWLETRIDEELAIYPGIVRLAHDIIDEAFSRSVIAPGETTTSDVEWWMRDKVTALGLDVWFHPSVSIQRADNVEDPRYHAINRSRGVIVPGDFLHVDFGITYLHLNTDTQQHAYVLKPLEEDAPEGLRMGLAAVNRATDHLTRAYQVGRTSNGILLEARRTAINDGLRPSFYTHGIGYHGHGGGGNIGMWDDQSGELPTGERLMRAGTAWSIELNTTEAVEEWGGQDVIFKAEEDAIFDGRAVRFLDGRQTRLHLIPSL